MNGNAKKKLALVFTGAVSLGSFEAGVACEIIRHVQSRENQELEVDVIVGTSAGALTGALAAQVLVFGLDPEIIGEAWMSVKLEDLLRLHPRDKSLLSSRKVEDLIERYIGVPRPGMKVHRPCEAPVNLSVVVTNLDGIKYMIHRAKDTDFTVKAIGYEDAVGFRIDPGFADWERLRNAVRASSAYPAAFEPKTIVRNDTDFRRVAKYNFRDRQEKSFHYSDGGIVNNQPLNRAIEIVNELPDENSGGQRVFLVIDPAPPGEDLGDSNGYGVFDVVAKAVWTIPRNQTLYKDLLLLEKVNRRINWKNKFVSAMVDMWNSGTIPAEKAKMLDDLCREVARFKGQTILNMDPARYLNTELERIRSAYPAEVTRAANPQLFTKYCYLLEQVADLRNKQEIAVEMITPEDAEKELAGVIFGNFGGFLNSEFMKHDYNVGRIYARRWLEKEQGLNRAVLCRAEAMPNKVNRKILQMVFDNSVPLLVEDLGLKMFGGKHGLTGTGKAPGKITLLRMFSLSLAKYFVRKPLSWLKEQIGGP